MLELAERIVASVWRLHFHIPPAAYWALSVAGTAALVLELPPHQLAWIFAIVIGAQGIFRWRWHKRRSLAMAVARFSAIGRAGLPVHVQQLIMTSLLDKLPAHFHELVHAVPATVGTADRAFASTLLRRLECLVLIHGRIEERSDGALAVFARSAQPAEQTVIHLDWHTRDRTPARARWSHLFELLTPTERVQVTEYPLDFATELEALVRGFAGQLFMYAGLHGEAEPLLRAALAVAPRSKSHQVDQLRAALARSLAAQDRRDEALGLLRARADGDNPSPELLRTLALLLHPAGEEENEEDAREAVALLRRAAEYETDPARDMTLYNLATQLTNRGEAEDLEAEQLFQQLLHSSPFYRGTWYLHRHLGAIAYHRALTAQANDDGAAAHDNFRIAASFYSKALRARPRLRFFESEGLRRYVIRTYPPSPILVANAVDAHRGAGHRRQAWWLERRFQHLRGRFLRIAEKALTDGDWNRAYAYADWAIVGRQDSTEGFARLFKAVAAQQMPWDEIAQEEWRLALELEPLTLVSRAELAKLPGLTRGVPGSEPTSEMEVLLFLKERGVIQLEPESQN